jgi:hypothetical protein
MSAAPGPAPEDDDELELEPVDPEIAAHRQRRIRETTDRTVRRAEAEQASEDDVADEIGLDLTFLREGRFSTRQLLAATGCLALALALLNGLGPCNGPFVIALALLAAGWLGVRRLERRRDAMRRDAMRRGAGEPGGSPDSSDASQADRPPSAASGRWRDWIAVEFSFSTRELLLAVTAAAVVLAVFGSLGAELLALALGLAALLGLVVNALGCEPPRSVVLGWWLLMAMYVAVGLVAALT